MTEGEQLLEELAQEQWAGLSLADREEFNKASWMAGFRNAMYMTRAAVKAGFM